jgi:alanyl-tRNA synthetase
MALDEAVAAGAMSLFGEKIRERCTRAVDRRFFDGTLRRHSRRTSRRYWIVQDHRRIRRRGGRAPRRGGHRQAAYEWVVRTDQVLRDIAGLLRGSREDVDEKVRELVERSRTAGERRFSSSSPSSRAGRAAICHLRQRMSAAIKVLAAQIDGADAKSLRDAVDQLKS